MQKASQTGLTLVGFCLIFITIFRSSWALAGEIQLSLNSPQYMVAAKQTGDVFEIPKFGRIEEPGAPALPMDVYWVALPPNAVDGSVSLSVQDKASVPISEKLEIAPVRPATIAPSGDPPQKVINHLFETKDLRIYGKSALFPAQSIRMGHVSKMRKTKLIPVTFYPIRYNPITKEAVWVRNIRFKLSFDESQSESPTASTTDDMIEGKNLPGPILNPQDLDAWYGEDKTRVGMRSLLGDGYAIITTDAVKVGMFDPVDGMLRQFATHKDGLGYTVYLVTETQAHHHPGGSPEVGYGSATGQQRAVNIRNWLAANHDAAQKNIKYVLLIGNPDPDDPEDAGDSYGDIPMMMCFPEFVPGGGGTGTPKAPTDYFYAELSGDWNLDGDSRYCEYNGDHGTGGVEFTPEVYVGRIPFSDSTRVEKVLQKVLDYESVSYSSSDNSTLVWRKKVLLPMSILNFGSTAWWGCPGDGSTVSDEAYLGISSEKYLLHPNGFDSFLMTEQDGDPTNPVTVSPIIGDAHLAEGIDAHWDVTKYYGIVLWSVHGTETYVSRKYWPDSNFCPRYNTVFSASDCNNLSDDYPAFVISTSCNIGYPENSGNLATTLIEKGAISAVAGSRTLWYVEGDFSRESADYLPKPIHLADLRTTAYWFAEQLTQDISAGDALFYAKQAKSTSSAMAWTNNFGMNLYGDPSLKILPPSFSDTDSDGDGLSDDEELYIYQSNPDQQDSDGDGLLDNEELVYMEGAWMYDLDGDGKNALNDKDSDGDALDDDIEILVLLTHPRMTDSDNDGLGDFEEVNRDGDPGNYTPGTDTDPNDADTDDDGVNDGDEVNAGMDPLDPWDNKATAEAGPDQYVDVQPGGVTVVELDGTGSSDPNDDPLFFYWRVESTISEYYPGGHIQPYTSPTPTLHAPVGGDYEISLKVREDRENYVWSDLDYVTIYVQHKITGLSPQPCIWGDTLTITGLGFDKDPAQNTVTLGGVRLLVTSASHSELQVTVPEGTAEGDVIVTVNNKASNSTPCSIEMPAGSFSLAPDGSVPILNDCSQNVAIEDVDGDDDLDIVVANMGGLSSDIQEYEDSACVSMDPQNRLYINNGQGIFTDVTYGPDGLAGTSDDRLPMDADQSRDVKLADIDDDDDLDIVIANYGVYKEWWEDVGMEGRLECSGAGAQNRIYLNNGQGVFTDETSSRLPTLSDPTVTIAIGDIDGDDDPDLIFGNDQDCQEAQWLEPSNPDCCWDCGECDWVDCEDDPWHPCCTGECDSCGPCCHDCIDCPSNPGCQPYNTPQASKDVFYLNNGGGIFSDVTTTLIGSMENDTATRSLALADMDGDNDPDMVRSGYMGNYTGTRLFENNLGSFTLVAPQVDNGSGREIVLANFDSDSASTLDVFIPRTNEYPIYRIQEGGVFVDHSRYGDDWLPGNTSYSNDYRDAVAAARVDVDLDGDPDVVIGRKNSEPNRLFINNNGSPGHFEYTAGMLPELSESTFGVTFGDVNGDRAPDLFFANVGQNTLLINNTETTEPCEGDFEPDGDVDESDLAIFAADFGRTNCSDDCEGDIDGDDDVDGSSLATFAAYFGRTNCPH